MLGTLQPLFFFILLYSLSIFVFFNQKRNRVNVWFFLLQNTIGLLFLFCFFKQLPSLAPFGEFSEIFWESTELFMLGALPFILLAYINAKTRFQHNKWIVVGSFVLMGFLSSEMALLWSGELYGLTRQTVMLFSVSLSSAIASIVLFNSILRSSIYIYIGLFLIMLTPIASYFHVGLLYPFFLVFGVFSFFDLRRHNAQLLHQKEVANFIIGNAQDCILVTDSNRKVIFCNKYAKQELGLTLLNSNGEQLESVINLAPDTLWETSKKALVMVNIPFKNESKEYEVTFSEIKRNNKNRGYVLLFSCIKS